MPNLKIYFWGFFLFLTQITAHSHEPDILSGVAAGSYSNNTGGIFPLLVSTHDNGVSWDYPSDILQNLKKAINPHFDSGIFSDTACTSSTSNLCIALGQWCNGSFCENALPLVAVSKHKFNQWFYPKSVFKNLKTVIDPLFTHGSLTAGSCFGSGKHSICIASGTYYTGSNYYPLLALSSKRGKKWTYPRSIFKKPAVAIDRAFVKGYFSTASCTSAYSRSVCIASGNFCTTNDCHPQLPLLALSRNRGKLWSYPPAIFKDLKRKVNSKFQSGFFISSSCTGQGNKARCIAVGSYTTATGSTMPLLTLTTNGGKKWSYPPDLHKKLPQKFGKHLVGGLFNAASCSGNDKKATCIASGSLFTRSGSDVPFLTISKDGGSTWLYPAIIYTRIKTLVDPEFAGGVFTSASCMGEGTHAICMAAGSYCNKQHACFPLVAVTMNGGKTWGYPSSIYSNLSAIIDPNYTLGLFSSVSCHGTTAHHLCIASGQYSNNTSETFPLIAFSTDSGQNWLYPPYVFKNLTSTIEPGFAIGSLGKAATTTSLR